MVGLIILAFLIIVNSIFIVYELKNAPELDDNGNIINRDEEKQ